MIPNLMKEQFVYKARLIHGDKYDYSKVIYKNNAAKIIIICDLHGEFLQSPNCHLSGRGCAICGRIIQSSKTRKNTDTFIENAKIVHGDKYSYSKTLYTISKNKVTITCPIHGDFEQTASAHLIGNGCNNCFIDKHLRPRKITKDEFIEKSKLIHGDKFGYNEINYIDYETPIKLYCNTHSGYFFQSPKSNLYGNGCLTCARENNMYKKDSWTKNTRSKLGCFYIIRCFNENESFYKYGITTNSIFKRYDNKIKMPYNYEVIRLVISTDKEYIWDLEKRFSKFKKQNRYNPIIKFPGSKNECFSSYSTTHNPNIFY